MSRPLQTTIHDLSQAYSAVRHAANSVPNEPEDTPLFKYRDRLLKLMYKIRDAQDAGVRLQVKASLESKPTRKRKKANIEKFMDDADPGALCPGFGG